MSIKILVQVVIFPKTDLRKHHILIAEQQLTSKMNLRELIDRSKVACGSITMPSSWPEWRASHKGK